MQYMRLSAMERAELLASLAGMSEYLRTTFATLTSEEAHTAGADGAFSPVEQVWHLADLERDGFGERIRRLSTELEPHLPDFDGTRVAAERDYRSLSLAQGLVAFAEARRRNIATLRAVPPEAWVRNGIQEGVGQVSLCDMPSFMFQHDSAHRIEIEAWRKFVGQQSSVP
jgi:hypothetical protein